MWDWERIVFVWFLEMPTIRVETNLGPEFFQEGFMSKFIVAVAELLGKDKTLMKYVFDTNKDMTMVSRVNQTTIY